MYMAKSSPFFMCKDLQLKSLCFTFALSLHILTGTEFLWHVFSDDKLLLLKIYNLHLKKEKIYIKKIVSCFLFSFLWLIYY